MIHENSLTANVLNFIEANPGLSTKEIAKLLPGPRKSVQRAAEYLRHHKVIENRGGGTGHITAWYALAPPKIKAKYRKLAADILAELAETHHTKREDVLARRLQDLLDER